MTYSHSEPSFWKIALLSIKNSKWVISGVTRREECAFVVDVKMAEAHLISAEHSTGMIEAR